MGPCETRTEKLPAAEENIGFFRRLGRGLGLGRSGKGRGMGQSRNRS
ncbi:MAG: hypothetical protein U9N38_04020 [Thermodesulfobacteriota bacterium]|nr:hypothetical protein [Thermodesulfobacteriota bacterium]